MKSKKLKHPFFVIIGPSGSGKTKVAEAVFPAECKVISHTTRPIRKEEEEGIDYYFETKEEFESLIKAEALAEYDIYQGNYYGVGIDELLQKTNEQSAYDVLTIKGFNEIEKRFGSMVIPIFLEVSKKNVLLRLKTREDDEEIIKERIALYDQEIQNKNRIMNQENAYIIEANQPYEKVVTDVKQVVNHIIKMKLG